MKKCMGCMRDYSENSRNCPICGYSPAQAAESRVKMPDALEPETILSGRYIIGRVLSYSDYGIIYIAWDALLQKRVTIKEYFPLDLAGRSGEELVFQSPQKQRIFETGKQYFELEIRKLNHCQDISGITEVYRCIQENHTSYLVMEYLEGITLQEYLELFPKCRKSVFYLIFPELMKTMLELQKRGICHGNLLPEHVYITNIITEKQTEESVRHLKIKAIGFSEAKSRFYRETGEEKEEYNSSFTAPELLESDKVNEQSDLYALGCIAFWLLTGKEITEKEKRRGIKLSGNMKKYERIVQLMVTADPKKRPEDLQQLKNMCSKEEQRRFFAGGQE